MITYIINDRPKISMHKVKEVKNLTSFSFFPFDNLSLQGQVWGSIHILHTGQSKGRSINREGWTVDFKVQKQYSVHEFFPHNMRNAEIIYASVNCKLFTEMIKVSIIMCQLKT
jgi:hypothetical protein